MFDDLTKKPKKSEPARADDLGTGPIEVPWRLIATTQPDVRDADGHAAPDSMSAALFSHEPVLRDAGGVLANHRLIYFRVVVTFAPGSFLLRRERAGSPAPGQVPPRPVDDGRLADLLLTGGDPIRAALVDMRVQAKSAAAGRNGTPSAWFVGAAPLRRQMIESVDVTLGTMEGETSNIAIGKSFTQLQENVAALSTTTRTSGGASVRLGPLSLGASGGTTDVDSSSAHASRQEIDSTLRDAGVERRDLVQYYSSVSNVLSLLTARHIGTSHLQFCLRPRPVLDFRSTGPNPDQWLVQLLRRRSSGLEGVQDFYAIAMVPDDAQDVEVSLRVKAAHTFDEPPSYNPEHFEPHTMVWRLSNSRPRNRNVDAYPSTEAPADPSEYNPAGWPNGWWHRCVGAAAYVRRRFPSGTTLDALDVDLTTPWTYYRSKVPGAYAVDDDSPSRDLTVPGGTRLFGIRELSGGAPTVSRWLLKGHRSERRLARHLWESSDSARSVPQQRPSLSSGDLRLELREVFVTARVVWTEWAPWPPPWNRVAEEADGALPSDRDGYIELRPVLRQVDIPYKPLLTVLRELERETYERRLLESPVQSGKVYVRTLALSTRRHRTPAASASSRSSDAADWATTAQERKIEGVGRGFVPVGRVGFETGPGDALTLAASNWDDLDRSLSDALATGSLPLSAEPGVDDPRVQRVLVRRLLNRGGDLLSRATTAEVASLLGLSGEQQAEFGISPSGSARALSIRASEELESNDAAGMRLVDAGVEDVVDFDAEAESGGDSRDAPQDGAAPQRRPSANSGVSESWSVLDALPKRREVLAPGSMKSDWSRTASQSKRGGRWPGIERGHRPAPTGPVIDGQKDGDRVPTRSVSDILTEALSSQIRGARVV